MNVRLVVASGKNAGRVVSVSSSRFFLGRAPNCHLRCQSPKIAPHHCVILVGTNSLSVLDFGSKSGTYVNGKRVTGQRRLKTHDRLKTGPFEFEVQVVADSRSEITSKVVGAETTTNAYGSTTTAPAVPSDTAEAGPNKPLSQRVGATERLRDQKRRTSHIVGVCKTAQASRTAATTEEGAAEALKKLMSPARRNSHPT